jgi:transposase
VKKVIELLEEGLKYLGMADDADNADDREGALGFLNMVEISVKSALEHVRAKLKAPRRNSEGDRRVQCNWCESVFDEEHIKTVMKRMAEYGAEAVLSYEEEQRMRRAERLVEEG